jgi:hypothetical protein
VFVYLGPPPSFTGCSQNVWIASGNLIGSTDGRFDPSQVQAGTRISTYAHALALAGGSHRPLQALGQLFAWPFPLSLRRRTASRSQPLRQERGSWPRRRRPER